MHGRIILPTATWLALLAPAARAQSPPQPGKSPPLLGAPAPLLALPPQPEVARLFGAPQSLVMPHVVTPRGPRTLVWGPGPVGLSLGWAGRQLQRLEHRHVWTIGHTVSRPVRVPSVTYYQAIAAPQPAPLPQYDAAPLATPQRRVSADEEVPPAPAPPATMRLVPPVGDIAVLPAVR
jgi:hypothetical protein